MKRSSIARTSLTVAGALILACTTGCDQGGGQALTQLTESFNTRVAEKDKQLTEARNALQLATNQKSEAEGKLSALQAELDKVRASGGNSSGGGPSVSAAEISAQVAKALEPMIRSAVKDLAKNLPPSVPAVTPNPGPGPARMVRDTPIRETPNNNPSTPPPNPGTGSGFDFSDPKPGSNRRPPGGTGTTGGGVEMKEKPTAGTTSKPPRDDGPIETPPPRGGNKDAKDDKVRPKTNPNDKIPIEFPPVAPR